MQGAPLALSQAGVEHPSTNILPHSKVLILPSCHLTSSPSPRPDVGPAAYRASTLPSFLGSRRRHLFACSTRAGDAAVAGYNSAHIACSHIAGLLVLSASVLLRVPGPRLGGLGGSLAEAETGMYTVLSGSALPRGM